MSYLVTAVVEDNRESTHKVCARVESSYNAVDAIVFRIMALQGVCEEVVKETWAILFLSCMYEVEGQEAPLPTYESETQK